MEKRKDPKEHLYLPVPEVRIQDLLDWRDPDQRSHRHLVHRNGTSSNELRVKLDSLASAPHQHAHKKCFGDVIHLNDEMVALFRIGNEVYATQASCPHAGGPLHLADIEELIPGQVCLKCPWHKWTFDIDTGKSVRPTGRGLTAKVYPVRVDEDGRIFIGFDSFGPSAFTPDF